MSVWGVLVTRNLSSWVVAPENLPARTLLLVASVRSVLQVSYGGATATLRLFLTEVFRGLTEMRRSLSSGEDVEGESRVEEIKEVEEENKNDMEDVQDKVENEDKEVSKDKEENENKEESKNKDKEKSEEKGNVIKEDNVAFVSTFGLNNNQVRRFSPLQ